MPKELQLTERSRDSRCHMVYFGKLLNTIGKKTENAGAGFYTRRRKKLGKTLRAIRYKFSDFIHSQKRLPGTISESPAMMWDSWLLSPESLHQVTTLFSDRRTPDGFRYMHNFSSHAYSLINSTGALLGKVALPQTALR